MEFNIVEAVLHDEKTVRTQIELLRRMTLEQRWQAARQLYWTVRRHKAAFLISQHPDWSAEMIQKEVGRIFLYGRT